MTHLDRARPVFRGWAILFFVGGAVLAYLLLARLLGHWTWGVAGGLLWLAQPDLTDCHPDQARHAALRTAAPHGLPARARLGAPERRRIRPRRRHRRLRAHDEAERGRDPPALVLAAALRPPGEGWWSRLGADSRSFAARHRVGVAVTLALWLAAFLALNWNRFAISAHGAHTRLLAALVVLTAVYAAATLAVRELGGGPVLRRVFDPLYLVLVAAFTAGMALPLSLVLSDSLRVLVGTLDTLRGRNINAGVTPFKLSLHEFTSFPLLEVAIVVALAAVAAAVGALRRNAWPVLWFTAAGATALLATLRFGQPRYYAPAYVLALPAALWLFRRRSSDAAPLVVWALVAAILTPTLLHLRDSSRLASFAEAQSQAETLLGDRLLKPNEVALLSDYYAPSADVRWWSLVDLYTNDPPRYPYRFVPDVPAAIEAARSQGKHVGYYMGSLALRVRHRETIELGSGPYVAVPLPGVPAYPDASIGAVRLVSGLGPRRALDDDEAAEGEQRRERLGDPLEHGEKRMRSVGGERPPLEPARERIGDTGEPPPFDDAELGPRAPEPLEMPEEDERRARLIRVERRARHLRIVVENGAAQVGALPVEQPVGERRNGRAVRIEHEQAPTRREHARRLVEESTRPGEVMEDVDEHEVRD